MLNDTLECPKSLVDILKHRNIELLGKPDIELEIAKWIEKIVLDKIPISDLVRLRVGPILESFCELAKNSQMGQGLRLLAESTLKKLKSLTFSSVFSKGINAKQRKANQEKPRLKLEIIIKKPKAKAQVSPLQNESFSSLKQDASPRASNTFSVKCTEPILDSQKKGKSARIIPEMESVSTEYRNGAKNLSYNKVSSIENVEGQDI